MTKEELIDILKQVPDGSEIVLMDMRMNLHHADDEGTSEGIYTDYSIEQVPTIGLVNVTAIVFDNTEDYDDEGNKLKD